MRGRKPMPSAKRRLQGNAQRRPMNAEEPQIAEPTHDLPPIELESDAVAQREWLRLMPLLRKARAITEGDRGSLLALCQQWSRYLTANAHVAGTMIVRSPSGYPMPNPYIGIANKSLGNCVKLWIELGLTPSARSRVKADGTAAFPDDAFAEFDEPTTTPH